MAKNHKDLLHKTTKEVYLIDRTMALLSTKLLFVLLLWCVVTGGAGDPSCDLPDEFGTSVRLAFESWEPLDELTYAEIEALGNVVA